MFNWLNSRVVLAGLGALILGACNLGCVASGRMTGGEADVWFKPAVVWKVNTGLYFYGGDDGYLQIKNAKIEGSAESRGDAGGDPD